MPTTTLTNNDDVFTFPPGGDVADLSDDTIYGLGGDDSIIATQGDDIIYGGDGADTINSSFGLNFPDLSQIIPTVTDGGDTVYGGAGDDVITSVGPDPDGPGGQPPTPSSIRDTVYGGLGNDSIVGNVSQADPDAVLDTLYGGAGNDTIDGNTGNDLIYGGAGNDLVLARADADTTDGGAGIDTIDFTNDSGAVVFNMETGETTVTGSEVDLESNTNYENAIGSTENDTITGTSGANSIAGGIGDDFITGGENAAIGVTSNDGSDTFAPGAGSDSIIGGEDAGDTDIDVLDYSDELAGVIVTYTGDESGTATGVSTGTDQFAQIENIIFTTLEDAVDASADTGGVTLFTDAGNDFVESGQGADTLDGGDDIDELSYLASPDPVTIDVTGGTATVAAAGGDVVDTIANFEEFTMTDGNDSFLGGDGDDSVEGELGNDTIEGGLGNDTLDGGADADVFNVTVGDGDDSIVGGEAGDDNDTIVVEGTPFEVIYGGPGGAPSEEGTINILDAGGNTVDTITFDEIENIVCFTRGTMIATPDGEKAIEDLEEGDLVLTRDNGAQALHWIGSQAVPAKGKRAPVMIKAGALGNDRDLRVSQLHRMLVADWRAELMFDEPEVLVAAKHLINGDTIYIETDASEVEYFHMLFEGHEIVTANGAAAESFHPGEQGIGWMAEETREEIFEIFPELRVELGGFGPAARTSLKAFEARALKR